jgi:hypothetical protein
LRLAVVRGYEYKKSDDAKWAFSHRPKKRMDLSKPAWVTVH